MYVKCIETFLKQFCFVNNRPTVSLNSYWLKIPAHILIIFLIINRSTSFLWNKYTEQIHARSYLGHLTQWLGSNCVPQFYITENTHQMTDIHERKKEIVLYTDIV